MMELSEEDITRLEKAGHLREDFVVYGEDATCRLRNVESACYFFTRKEGACRVYQHRPLGCDLYPVNCDGDGLIFVDDFCPAADTISGKELKRKGDVLVRHLRRIDAETARRRPRR